MNIADAVRSTTRIAIAFVMAMLVTRCSLSEETSVVGILGSTHSVRLPPAAARPLGFTTEVQIGIENSVGYLPVRITLRSTGVFPAERRFVYRFRTFPGAQTPPQNGLVTDVPIVAPQGAATASFVRYLPKWSAGMGTEIFVLEDGRRLEDYTALVAPQILGTTETGQLLSSEYEVDWLFIGPEPIVAAETEREIRTPLTRRDTRPDVRSRTESRLSSTSQGTPSNRNPVLTGQRGLPHDWRAYQRYDAVVIGTPGLQRLRPQGAPFRALRGWILNGGTVVIYDAASSESALDLIDFRSKLESEETKDRTSIANRLATQLNEHRTALTEQVTLLQRYLDLAGQNSASGVTLDMDSRISSNPSMRLLHEQYRGNMQRARQALAGTEQSLDASLELDSPRAGQIWAQSVGAGSVIGIQESDQFSFPPTVYWQTIRGFIGHHASPIVRRGVDPMLGDRRFSRWLIPGVAEPPVYTFIGLLTVFVILVGPVAYRRTAKQGRSYLMFAIAPALALLTTVAMFGYGIVSDGFGTVVRARQLTWVDGKSGDAGERIRTTYFAGVRPDQGLRFTGDAEVMAYPESSGSPWRELNQQSPARLGSIRVLENSQIFESSFLPSRQQRQFVVHAPRLGVGHLQLSVVRPASDQAQAKSGFDFAVREAVMRDSRGVYWTIRNLAPGSTANCTPLSVQDASKVLGRLYNDFRPLSRVRETSTKQRRYDNRIYDVIVYASRQIDSSQTVTEGIFEHWLQRHLQTMGEIPPDHFVAIADVSGDVVAVEQSELVASVRYIFGTLR